MTVERARRWPPRQRIHLTAEGEAARAAHQELVRAARESGLAEPALAERLASWAGQLGVRACDAVLLDELASKAVSVNDLARAVELCGLRAPEVKAGVDRLYGSGLIEPPASEPLQAPPIPPWRS